MMFGIMYNINFGFLSMVSSFICENRQFATFTQPFSSFFLEKSWIFVML